MTLRITAIKSLLTSFLVALTTAGMAQIYDPVSWTFSVQEQGDDYAVLSLKAEIEEGWHVYATELPSDDGPIATSFSFNKDKGYALDGAINEPEFITKFDPNFDMELNFHDGQAHFTQRVKLKSKKAMTISGYLTFMTCDDEKCLPPEDVDFNFEIKARESIDSEGEKIEKSGSSGFSLGEAPESEESGILEPVTWSFDLEEKGDNKFVFVARAEIDDTWHLYGQDLESDEGPMPTEFLFEKVDGLELIGKVSEPTPITKYDPVFEMVLSYFDNSVEFRQEFENTGGMQALVGSVGYMACDDKRCIFPPPEEFNLPLPGVEQVDSEQENTVAADSDDKTKKKKKESDRSLIGIFILAFFGGFAALLTPCVFPMIPMTVSFFTKQSKTRAKGITNALLYGLAIILIYVALGFGVTVIFGADALNAMSTNVWFNVAFFLLLVIFAISFFGAFEITLPSSFINKVDKNADRGGLIGIFFMAFTLALVSFSCTGPIIGTLLVEAAYVGGTTGPLVGMFGFSLALALPFALFAAFPGWLNTLPQSGGWLNSVKVILGFLELALAFKFLSNADLVLQLGIITREVFIAIWIGVFLIMAFYLFGAFRLPHDSKLEHLSVGRMLFGIVTVIFVIYLIPGMWGAPLKIISGFPPPLNYAESPTGIGGGGSSGSNEQLPDKAQLVVHGLVAFKDYEAGLAYAKEVNKPVLIDFTGHACVNCRKMEEQVWSEPEVLNRLKNDVVLISLYVDDKRSLPKEEQIEVTIGSKTRKLKTIGNKWSHFQASRYNSNSQPQYVLMDHNEENLVPPTAYDLDVQNYVDWLDKGIDAFKAQ